MAACWESASMVRKRRKEERWLTYIGILKGQGFLYMPLLLRQTKKKLTKHLCACSCFMSMFFKEKSSAFRWNHLPEIIQPGKITALEFEPWFVKSFFFPPIGQFPLPEARMKFQVLKDSHSYSVPEIRCHFPAPLSEVSMLKKKEMQLSGQKE